MAGITLQNAKDQLQLWLDASAAVALGQSYTIADRSVTKADAEDIAKAISFWNRQVKKLDKGGLKMRRGIPAE